MGDLIRSYCIWLSNNQQYSDGDHHMNICININNYKYSTAGSYTYTNAIGKKDNCEYIISIIPFGKTKVSTTEILCKSNNWCHKYVYY